MRDKEKIEVMQAYIDGKVIQTKYSDGWVDNENPRWAWDEWDYRIKPEPKESTLDNEMPQEQFDYINRICKDVEEATNMTHSEAWDFGLRCWQCGYDRIIKYEEAKPESKYRPFKDSTELVEWWGNHYCDKNRPEHTMPLVWVKFKNDSSTEDARFITEFWNDGVIVGSNGSTTRWQDLFEKYTFLDGKPCGMEENR